MQNINATEACSILNSNESEVETIKNNFKVIPMKKDANEFVYSFNIYAVKTAQNTLEMCRVVREAKSELSKSDFDKFCFATYSDRMEHLETCNKISHRHGSIEHSLRFF